MCCGSHARLPAFHSGGRSQKAGDGVESLSVVDYSRPAVAADGSAFHHIAIVDGGDDLGIITGGRLITQIGYFFGRHGVAGLGPDDVAGIHVLRIKVGIGGQKAGQSIECLPVIVQP